MIENNVQHPCFNGEAKEECGRIHLPVAPRCNIQCNYCNRKYDCVSESRPGITSKILTPRQGAVYFDMMKEANPWLTVAGIAGPGDSLANFEKTIETVELIREQYPDMIFCISTNGLNLDRHLDSLLEAGVRYLTVTVNAVDPEIGAQIYKWVRLDGKILRGVEAARVLQEAQKKGIIRAAEAEMHIKVNTILLPGINEHHVDEVAAAVSSWGAEIQNCLPLIPAEGSAFADMSEPDHSMVHKVRRKAGEKIAQMLHCGRCRSDSVGLIGRDCIEETVKVLDYVVAEFGDESAPQESGERKYLAVASFEGVLINQHLGEAEKFHIYRQGEEGPVYLESREAPPKGTGDKRWKDTAALLRDCEAVLVSGFGPRPGTILNGYGLQVLSVQGLIENVLIAYMNGTSMGEYMKLEMSCGSGCRGNARGCM